MDSVVIAQKMNAIELNQTPIWSIFQLPNELLVKIFEHVFTDFKEFLPLSAICRKIHQLIYSPKNSWWRCNWAMELGDHVLDILLLSIADTPELKAKAEMNQQIVTYKALAILKAAKCIHRLKLELLVPNPASYFKDLQPEQFEHLTELNLYWIHGSDSLSFLKVIGSASPHISHLVISHVSFICFEHMLLINRYWGDLKSISMPSTNLSDDLIFSLFTSFKNNDQLEAINFDRIPVLTDRSVVNICNNVRNLKHLILDATTITNLAIKSMTNLNNLTTLMLHSLYFNDQIGINDTGILKLKNLRGTLKHLHLHEFNNITANGFIMLFDKNTGLSMLRHLMLFFCANLDDACIDAITSCSFLLESLSLNGCFNLTDNALVYITQRLCGLRMLELCDLNVTGQALIGTPVNVLPNLLYLGVDIINFNEIIYDIVKRSQGQTTVQIYENYFYNALWFEESYFLQGREFLISTKRQQEIENMVAQTGRKIYSPTKVLFNKNLIENLRDRILQGSKTKKFIQIGDIFSLCSPLTLNHLRVLMRGDRVFTGESEIGILKEIMMAIASKTIRKQTGACCMYLLTSYLERMYHDDIFQTIAPTLC